MNESVDGIEACFHALIRERAKDFAAVLDLPLLPKDARPFEQRWLPIPGMHGGFAYSLSEESDAVVLIVESWSRVVSGSGQRHRITATGCELLEEWFV